MSQENIINKQINVLKSFQAQIDSLLSKGGTKPGPKASTSKISEFKDMNGFLKNFSKKQSVTKPSTTKLSTQKPSIQKSSIPKPSIKKPSVTAKVKTFDDTYRSKPKASSNKENLIKNTPVGKESVLNLKQSINRETENGMAPNISYESIFQNPDIEKEEYMEAVKSMEFLLLCQENFYSECIEEIEKLEQEKKEIDKHIMDNSKKISQINKGIFDIGKYAEAEMVKILKEAEKYEEECNKMKSVSNEEEEKINEVNKEIEEAKLSLLERLNEMKQVEAEIRQEEQKKKQREEILKNMSESLEMYQNVDHAMCEELLEIIEKKKTLSNDLQELRGSIRTFCRIRPFLPTDSQVDMSSSMIAVPNLHKITLTVPPQFMKSENYTREYGYDLEHIFDQASRQEDVFNEVCQLVQSILDGYNASIFCYGQTGSGKTFTMQGDGKYENRGLMQRSLEYIFEQVKCMKKIGWDFKVYVSFQEVYLEAVKDLMTNITDFKGECTSVLVTSADEVLPLLQRAIESRKVSSTACNEFSSRSHCIVTVTVVGKNYEHNQETNGILNLVDLAGSERLTFSKVKDERLKETQAINKSLTSLSDVISALSSKAKHIPVRNSKLTQVLSDTLLGDSRVIIIVNLSPCVSHFAQTQNALQFAQKASGVHYGTQKKNIKFLKQF